MKNILITLGFLTIVFCVMTLTSCNHKLINSSKDNSIKYSIYKIDSINNYYLIYAENNKKWYKIISKKDSINKCDKIKIGEFYSLNLNSMLTVNGKPIIPPNQINEVSGWRIDKFTTVKFEGDSIRDLFISTNIKDLCYIKN